MEDIFGGTLFYRISWIQTLKGRTLTLKKQLLIFINPLYAVIRY